MITLVQIVVNGTLCHCITFAGIASGLACCGGTPSMQSGCQRTGKRTIEWLWLMNDRNGTMAQP